MTTHYQQIRVFALAGRREGVALPACSPPCSTCRLESPFRSRPRIGRRIPAPSTTDINDTRPPLRCRADPLPHSEFLCRLILFVFATKREAQLQLLHRCPNAPAIYDSHA